MSQAQGSPPAAPPPAVETAEPAELRRALPGWAISAAFHGLILGTMAMFTLPPNVTPPQLNVEAEEEQLAQAVEIPKDYEPQPIAPEAPSDLQVQTDAAQPKEMTTSTPAAGDGGGAGNPDADAAALAMNAVSMSALEGVAAAPVGNARAEAFGARGTGRGQALSRDGGTLQTEYAVNAGLQWILKHQFSDGSWRFDYGKAPGRKGAPTTGSGDAKADVAGTGLGLLPLLAAGNTHQRGAHAAAVKRGLDFLLKNQLANGMLQAPGDQSPMYSHALATIALCEDYAMTKDPALEKPVGAAVRFILNAQNKNPHSGWRYEPDTKSADTSVFGWNFMALKSAMMGGINIPKENLAGARKYLDSVKHGAHGGLFAYDADNKGSNPQMTAIGLLSYQYLGRSRQDAAMKEGIDFLINKNSPDQQLNPYYWYYSTQVIHHVHGPEWEKWNRAMRRIWVDRQIRDKNDPDFGSWDIKQFGGIGLHDLKAGGRLYVTALGLLTLEVYYRYLPIYRDAGKETEAPEKPAEKKAEAKTTTSAK